MMPDETFGGRARWPSLAAGLALFLAGCATTPADISRWVQQDGDAAAGRIAPQLESPDPAMRHAALVALMRMPDSDTALTALAAVMLSPVPDVRADAGCALLFNPNPDLDFYAITLIGDPNPAVRRKMAEGLAAAGRAGPLINAQRAGIYLWGMTQDDDPQVRAAAAEGLGTLGLNNPVDFALTALRSDPDPHVRAAAAKGLGVLARAYLAGERGPDWTDQQVEQFLAPYAGRPPSVAQARGEEIVAALCKTAQDDTGQYAVVEYEQGIFNSRRVTRTLWVAQAAVEALTIPSKTPRPDVAAALAAAQMRLPSAPPAVISPAASKSPFATFKL